MSENTLHFKIKAPLWFTFHRNLWVWILVLGNLLVGCQSSKIATKQTNTLADSLNKNEIKTDSVEAAPLLPLRASNRRLYDLLHTKLAIKFDWKKQHVIGQATLLLRPYFYSQDSVVLDAKGFDIHSVKLITTKNEEEFEQDLKYQYNQRKLTIRLDKPYQRQESFTLEIDYTAKPEELPQGGSDAITSDKGLYFINPTGKTPNLPQQIWTQGETEASSCWFPTIDSPNERCTQEMYITVNKKFKTLSNGELVYSRENADNTRTDYWRMDLPHAPYLFMLAVGDFAVYKDKWKDKAVSYYVDKPFLKYAPSIFGRTPEMIGFFSKKLNYPFPWNKYAQVVVHQFVSGAMENTTASVFNEGLQIDDRALLDAHWDGIIAHELFHQWFGNLVTCESWGQLPLNEAFANYSEYLWAEHKYGVEDADYLAQIELRGYLTEADNKQVPLIRYRYAHREDMFDAHSYNKGGRVLHMLRKYVGDEAFWRSLNLYLTQNKFKSVEIGQLRQAFEQTTGEDLRWFFNQWFFHAGHPAIRVNHRYENGQVTLTTEQVNDSADFVYRLPLKVAIWSNGKRKVFPILIDKTQQEFTFRVSQKPNLVVFDAEQQLLGLIAHKKTDEELAYQYAKEPTYKARMEVLDRLFNREQLSPILEKTILKALNDPFWAIRQRAIEKIAGTNTLQTLATTNTLLKIAQSDPKTLVRASAITSLASFANKTNAASSLQSLYESSLKAKSYAVVGAALDALVKEKSANISEKIVKFEDYNALEVVSVVAQYYADNSTPKKYDWFVKKIQQTFQLTKHQLLQSFGIYLLGADATTQKKGAAFLNDITQNKNEAQAVKFLAYQSLSYLVDVEGVTDLLRKIKQGEKNPELKKMYGLIYND
ncbi:alanyl aminopeptidase [marine bacterium AO1-C]|nr:alanyl aminopeptidase [marine bacterium AO1-C]